MITRLYTSRIECISREIENALGEFVDDIDVERFADDHVVHDGTYYWLPMEPERFWFLMRDYKKPTHEDQEDQKDQGFGYRYEFKDKFGNAAWLREWSRNDWLAYGDDSPMFGEIKNTLDIMSFANTDVASAILVLEKFGYKQTKKMRA